MSVPVEEAVRVLQDQYGEPITLDALASRVYVSPFHFARMFARTVGLPPGRYLTAVRMFEAKRRLVCTDETITDIVSAVGYSSLGTFTSRFTRAVGMSPGRFRDPAVRASLVAVSSTLVTLPPLSVLRRAQRCGPGEGSVTVRPAAPSGSAGGRTVVGLFPHATPQGAPIACTAAGAGIGELTLEGVPPGRWTVFAAGERDGRVVAALRSVLVDPRLGPGPSVELAMDDYRVTDAPVAVAFTPAGRAEPVGRRWAG